MPRAENFSLRDAGPQQGIGTGGNDSIAFLVVPSASSFAVQMEAIAALSANMQ
jgi:hypothetical protein